MEDFWKEESEIGYMIYNALYTNAGYIAQQMNGKELDEDKFDEIKTFIPPIVKAASQFAAGVPSKEIIDTFAKSTKKVMIDKTLENIVEIFIHNNKIYAEGILKRKDMIDENDPDFLEKVTRQATLNCLKRLARVIA